MKTYHRSYTRNSGSCVIKDRKKKYKPERAVSLISVILTVSKFMLYEAEFEITSVG